MNKRIYLVQSLLTGFFSLLTLASAAQQSAPSSQQDVVKVAGATTDALVDALPLGSKETIKQYTDGLGRPIQSIALQASPGTNYDIVQVSAYNNLGQQTAQYLPYPDNQVATGVFRNSAVASQLSYYQNSNATTNQVAGDNIPYSQQVFENSPLQRTLQTGLVGTGFQPGVTSNHWKTTTYRNNTANEAVMEWSMTGVYANQSYPDNTLTVTDGSDEDGVETLLYKDSFGRTILKRQVANQTVNLTQIAFFDTYFVYNASGNLTYVIPPKATQLIKTTGDALTAIPVSNLIFKYVYDNLGRVIERTMPGTAVVYIIYDPLNRPVLLQDGNLRANNEWDYIKYDVKSRIVSQGIYTDLTNTTRMTMQGYVSGLSCYATTSTTWYESRTATFPYYSNVLFPTTNYDATHSALQDLTYSFYDDYDLNQNGTPDYSYNTAQNLTTQATPTLLTKNLNTCVIKRTVGATSIWLTTVYFYDRYGNVIQQQSNNQINYAQGVVTDFKTVVPDFTGKPTLTKTVKVIGTGMANTVAVTNALTYDDHDRLLSIDQTNNSQATVRIAAYSYNGIGQMVTKNLGSTAAGFLQSLSYLYNIRGQLLSINNSNSLASNSLFGMQMLYDQVDAALGNAPFFNGKVSAVKWQTKNNSNTNTNERSYKFSYDVLNRFVGATYAERTAGSSGNFTLNPDDFDENFITYDENGNILTLKRNSLQIGATSYSQINNLTYSYSNNTYPNRLNSVADAGTDAYGFRNLTSAPTTASYSYDNNGNLIGDPYKGLLITYNVLNKTDNIKFYTTSTLTGTTGRYINYTYNADGIMIRKQQYDNSQIVATTDYIEEFVYTSTNTAPTTVLSYFSMPEGRVVYSTGVLKPEYIIQDQQGNARFSFQDNGSGVATPIQENSYYPYGLVLANSPINTTGAALGMNKRLYNGGSEWQNDYGNLPDYYETYYRNYDASLGRWVATDPEAETSESLSVYHYANDNPINYNDPMGNDAGITAPLDDGSQWSTRGCETGDCVVIRYNSDQGSLGNQNRDNGAGGANATTPGANSDDTQAKDSSPLYLASIDNDIGTILASTFIRPNGLVTTINDGSNAVYFDDGYGHLIYLGASGKGSDQPNYNTLEALYPKFTIQWGGLNLFTITATRLPKQSSDNGNAKQLAGFDVPSTLEYINKKAYPTYDKDLCGGCAHIVRLALQEGGINTAIHPVFADHYRPFLLKWGFSIVSKLNYVPDPGDIRVFQPYPGGNPAGHIDIWNGYHWMSDFKENNDYPGKGYRDNHSSYEIFRWPDDEE